MAKLRISIVQYLNTAPLVRGFTHGPLRGKYELSFTVPSQCAEALRSGEADVAIIPAIEYQRIPHLVVLPDMAIASQHEVRSLLIVSKKPIEQARSIALDRSSRSTQALTRILAADKWFRDAKVATRFTEAAPDLECMLRDADAALLIGDPALRFALAAEGAAASAADAASSAVAVSGAGAQSIAAASAPRNVSESSAPTPGVASASAQEQDTAKHREFAPSPAGVARNVSAGRSTGPKICRGGRVGLPGVETVHVYDIVAEWRALTGLPAVLAVWAVRDSVAAPELSADFLASRDFGLRHISEICAEASAELNLPESECRRYLTENIDFTLGPENRRGLEHFFSRAAALGLIPEANPIAWL